MKRYETQKKKVKKEGRKKFESIRLACVRARIILVHAFAVAVTVRFAVGILPASLVGNLARIEVFQEVHLLP